MNFLFDTLITIVSSLFLLILSELVKEIFFVPFQEYKKLKAKVASALMLYAKEYANPITIETYNKDAEQKERYKKASDSLREIASELEGFIEKRNLCQPGVPKKALLYNAARQFTGLANGVYGREKDSLEFTLKRQDEIKKSLRLYKGN
jgi:hypothetical protein